MEMQEADSIGQDYIASLAFDSVLIFAVCDGVSESFMGNLAAQYLGDALIKWLENNLKTETTVDEFRNALDYHLRTLIVDATEAVQQYVLPNDIPKVLYKVLEQKRRKGSQTTFVCGRIDLPSAEFPQGRVALSWMGDSRLRVWREDGSPVMLVGDFETKQRWSTDRGPLNGRPNVYISDLQGENTAIQRVMAYTDGLPDLDEWDTSPPNTTVNRLIEDAGQKPQSDDIAFFEIWLGETDPHWHREVKRLPAPEVFDFALRGSELRLAWRPIPEATDYEVVCNQKQISSPVTSQEIPITSSGTYRVRLRACKDKVPGMWSDFQEVTISDEEVLERPKIEESSPWSRYGRWSAMVALAFITMCVVVFALSPDDILHRWFTDTPTATTIAPVIESPAAVLTPTSTPIPVWATATLSEPVSILPTPKLTPTVTMMPTETSTPDLSTSPTITLTAPTETPTMTLPALLSPISTPTSTTPFSSIRRPQP